ncbi:MAG TPA: serine hydrolase [Streptosporangiaceae bacterium]|nr:serine hydrolase [Streptosporangiaceae bacterium]
MFAVAGVALLIAAGIVAVFTLGGSGARPPGSGAAAATGDRSSSVPSAAAAEATANSSAPRPAASHYDPLGSAVASYVSTRDGVVLAAVYDLRTGQTWQFGQGQPQDAASVVKLDVLETLLAERGRTGTELSAGDRSLAEEMIEDSDNDAATSLWDEVGGAGGIRSFNTSAGLADTVPSSCVNCPGFPWPGWGLSTTIPGDQLTLLRTLVEPNSLLTNTERSYALSLMENVTPDQRWGVSAGVPAQVTVALKNGWLPLNSANNNWQINSVGWISGSGRDYLIAVLTTGNPTEQYGIDTIDQLAAMVWNEMA